MAEKLGFAGAAEQGFIVIEPENGAAGIAKTFTEISRDG